MIYAAVSPIFILHLVYNPKVRGAVKVERPYCVNVTPIAGTKTIFPNCVGALLAAPSERGRASPAPTGYMSFVKPIGIRSLTSAI